MADLASAARVQYHLDKAQACSLWAEFAKDPDTKAAFL